MTTRDSDALNIEKWAATGDVATPESTGLTRATGWPASYSQVGGDTPSREVFNQMFREITGMLNEVNTRGGILPWDTSIAYVHPALVMGGDGTVYRSVRNNTGVNPTTDADASDWEPEFREPLSQIIPTTGITDYDDLALAPGALIGYALVSSAITTNRPLDYSGSGLLMQYRAPGTPHQWQIVYPHSPTVPHGISYFQRRQHGGSGNWGAWGTSGTHFSVICTDGTATNPQFHSDSQNISGLVRDGLGHFEVTIALEAPIGRISTIQATAVQNNAHRNLQVHSTQSISSTQSNATFWLICFDNNGQQQNPTSFFSDGFLSPKAAT